MQLDEKPLDSQTSEDVNLLITEGICESSRLDYKRDWWGGSEGGRREMLRDISSLANSNGGYLVIGLETERGSGGGDLECPIEVVGLEPIDYQEMVIRSSRDGPRS